MPLHKRDTADTTLCLNFCRYFKAGKNDELACQGFISAHRIIRRGRNLPLERPDRTAVPDRGTLEGLKARVCTACSFHETDCDYVLTGGVAPPCGGFALLSHLLGSGQVTLDEIGSTTEPDVKRRE